LILVTGAMTAAGEPNVAGLRTFQNSQEQKVKLVMYGRPPLGKGFFGVSANGSGSGHVYGL
jgi:hypothetical protein